MLAAARALHELRQAEKQRDAAVEAAFEAEGLQEYLYSDLLPGVRRFGEHGEGSVAELVADARQLRQREEGQQARFDRIRELLAAEGLLGVRSSHEEFAFIGGWISEAQALAAVRLRAQEAAACAARRGALAAALAAEGIQFECRRLDYHRLFPSARAFIDHASGSQEEAVAAVRKAHQNLKAQEQRRAELAALLQAEGLSLAAWQSHIPGMDAFMTHSSGSAEALVAQAVAASQAACPLPGLQPYPV